MALFGKKPEKNAAHSISPLENVPTDIVIQMRQQGISDSQIVQDLQSRGYNFIKISDAMSQADIRGIVGSPEEPIGAPAMQGQPNIPPPPGFEGGMPPIAGPAGVRMEQQPETAGAATRDMVEEVAEGIIDEKWEELMKSVDKILAWKDSTERKIAKLEQGVEDLKERFESLHQGVLGKIEEYDKGIKSVGSDIRAMESVFKKILPSFTENVGRLSRLTEKIEKKKGNSE